MKASPFYSGEFKYRILWKGPEKSTTMGDDEDDYDQISDSDGSLDDPINTESSCSNVSKCAHYIALPGETHILYFNSVQTAP